MPLIRKKVEVATELVSLRLPVDLKSDLRRYCEMTGDDHHHVVGEMIRYVMSHDKDWKKLQASGPQKSAPESASAKAGK